MPGGTNLYWIASHAARLALRQRWVLLAAGGCAALVIGGGWLRQFHFGIAAESFVVDLGRATIGLFAPMMAAAGTVQVFFRELDSGSTATVLVRPIARSTYLIGLWAGVSSLTLGFVFTASVCLAAVAAAGVTESYWAMLGSIWVAHLSTWVSLGAQALLMAAFALVLAVLTRSGLAALLLSAGVWGGGNLRFLVLEMPAADGGWAVLSWVVRLLPDLGWLASVRRLEELAAVLAYASIYLGVCLLTASVVFARRDL